MHKQMLQLLLQDRFKLLVHKDTGPLPKYALIAEKKPLLKQSEGSEQTGCRLSSSAPAGAPAGPGQVFGRIMTMNPDGQQTTWGQAPRSNTIAAIYMEAFAANLRIMFGANLGPNPVLHDTGLKGNWNFDPT